MSNGYAFYKNLEGRELHLHIDVDLKSETIQDFNGKGTLLVEYNDEFEELKNLVINRKIKDVLNLKRESLKNEHRLKNGKLGLSSLSLWLLNSAIEDYLGTAVRLDEQKDLLCLCYGIGSKDLKKQILLRADYDLSKLIAETMATSACGSCRPSIEKTMQNIRDEHGIIMGLDHSQSRFDKLGQWVKIKNLYPADLVIHLDELKNMWMKREGIVDQFRINIVKIEGYHIWLTVGLADLSEENPERAQKILSALGDYWQSEVGALFFLHLGSL